MPRPIALITGASSGIGSVFARQLSAKGYDLILAARRLDRLRDLASQLPTQAEPVAADLSKPEDCHRLADRLRGEVRLELLVNNAGFGTRGRFWEANLEGQMDMHRVHVMATVELTHAALENMVKRGRGGVINVASVGAFTRSPSNASYCATKAWMVAFCEGLALELRTMGSGVKVQALCPGFTYSEFHDVLGVDRGMVPKWFWLQAEDVVRESLEGLERSKLLVIPGWTYKVFVSCFRRLPHGLQMAMQAKSPHTRGRL